MAFTSQRTKIELLSPVDGSVLVDITTRGRSASVSRRPTYSSRGYHRNAAVTAARLRTQGTVTLQLNADDLALLHELERWQKGVVWYPMAADLKGKRYRQPNIRITFLDAQGAVEEVVTAYGVKLSDESLDLGMGPAKESISLDVLGGFEPKEGAYEPVRALDFHRTGPATYLSPSGTLATAGDGEARFGYAVPPVRRNLWNNSERFDNFELNGAVSFALNQGVDTFGRLSLVKVTEDGPNWGAIRRTQNLSVTGKTLCVSFDAYTTTGTDAYVSISNNVNQVLSTSKVVSGNVARYSVVLGPFNGTASSTMTLSIGCNGSGVVLIGNIQIEEGSTATPYQPTNSSGVDYSHPLNGAGLVLEGSSTNLGGSDNSFESSTNGFYAAEAGTSVSSSSDAFGSTWPRHGTKSLKIVTGTVGSAGAEKVFNLTPGQVYTISAYVRPGDPGISWGLVFWNSSWGGITATGQTYRFDEGIVWATITAPGDGVVRVRCVRGGTSATTGYMDCFKIEASPFPTSWCDGSRAADRCGIVPLQNELLHSHDLTQSAWTKSGGASVSKVGTANTLTLAATTDYVYQAITPPDVPGTTRTLAVKLRLGTLSGSVRIRLLDQGGTQIASTTISTTDLHATDARTFTVTGTAASDDTGLQVQVIGNSGTGTVIVESMRLVRGSHPGIEVQTGDTPILPPPSPALDPAWSQNGRLTGSFVLPVGANVAAGTVILGGGGLTITQKASTIELSRTTAAGTRTISVAKNAADGYSHAFDASWAHYTDSAGVRKMILTLTVDGATSTADVAALNGDTRFADLDASRLVSAGSVFATWRDLVPTWPALPAGATPQT